jgi:hypothetical protein
MFESIKIVRLMAMLLSYLLEYFKHNIRSTVVRYLDLIHLPVGGGGATSGM